MSFLKKLHWFEWFILITIFGLHFYAALSAPHNFPSRWFTRDDAYYYFKVAQNISEGHGSTFDGINTTNGYHPLWMLICIPIFFFARFDLILPLRIMVVVMSIISILTSIILFRVLRKAFSETIAIVLVAFWTYTVNVHSIITQQGMETGIVALSTILMIYYLQKFEEPEVSEKKLSFKQASIFSALSLFVLLSRLDGIFFVLFACIFILFRNYKTFRTMIYVELIVGYVITVLAYINRSDLQYYLAVYDLSALTFTLTSIGIQTLVGLILGNYNVENWFDWKKQVVKTIISVAVGTGFASCSMLMVANFSTVLTLPRAVPMMYFIAMSSIMIMVRLLYAKKYTDDQNSIALDLKQGIVENWGLFRKGLRSFVDESLSVGWLSGGGLVIYMGFNRWFFGTFMPVSGQIKRWWGSMQNNVYGGPSQTIANMFGIDPQNMDGWFYISLPLYNFSKTLIKIFHLTIARLDLYWVLLFGLLIFSVILFTLYRHQTWTRMKVSGFVLLFFASFFHTFFYGASAYSAKHEWYWVLQMITTMVFYGLLLQIAYDLAVKNKILAKLAIGLAAVYCAYVIIHFGNEMITRMPWQDDMVGKPYIDMLDIIEQNTEPGSLIGMTGGGNIGYYIHDRTIMNMDGLINSNEYFQSLKNNHGNDFYRKVGLKYVFASKFILTNSSPYRYQFAEGDLKSVEAAKKYGNKELLRFTPNK